MLERDRHLAPLVTNLSCVKVFRFFAVAAAIFAFCLTILGSWVRINGAGMTCPDWPLCNGHLLPRLDGGVIYEWSHRLVALILGFVLCGTLVSALRLRQRIPGLTTVLRLLGVVFLLQVALGGLTVQLGNRPDSVVYHWATAMAFLATVTVLALLALFQPSQPLRWTFSVRLLSLAAFTAMAAMCAGAYVSSSGAGLACPTIPGCSSTSFWGGDGVQTLQGVQMLHRALAGLFFVTASWALFVTLKQGGRGRWVALLGFALLLLQIALGSANVLAQLPIGLREAHAANAAATFMVFVIAAFLEALALATPNEGQYE